MSVKTIGDLQIKIAPFSGRGGKERGSAPTAVRIGSRASCQKHLGTALCRSYILTAHLSINTTDPWRPPFSLSSVHFAVSILLLPSVAGRWTIPLLSSATPRRSFSVIYWHPLPPEQLPGRPSCRIGCPQRKSPRMQVRVIPRGAILCDTDMIFQLHS